MKLKEIKAKMPINKLWMQKSRVSQEYDNGVLEFLDFAFSNAPRSDKLPCPKQNNAIRALLLQSGWVVERLEDDSCMVTYVIQVSISKIINSSTKKQKQKLRFLFILWITLNIKLS